MSKGKKKQRQRKNRSDIQSPKNDKSHFNEEIVADKNKDGTSMEPIGNPSDSDKPNEVREVSRPQKEISLAESKSSSNSTEVVLKTENDQLRKEVDVKQKAIETLKDEKKHGATKTDEILKNEKKQYDELHKVIDTLRSENTSLREETEILRKDKEADSKAQKKIQELEKQLEEKSNEHDKVQENYHNLLSRLSSMKSVFTKMKASESELEKIKGQMKEANENNIQLQKENGKLTSDIRQLQADMNKLNLEYEKLSRMKISLEKTTEIKSNEYSLEVKRLQTGNKKLVADLQEARSEIEEYIIMIDEEKTSKQSLQHEVDELNKKCVVNLKEKEEINEESNGLKSERSKLIQELKALKAKYNLDSNEYKEQLNVKNQKLIMQQDKLDALEKLRKLYQESLDRNTALQEDIKSKQKTIGKLRRETIALNEHLTKAMKLIKQESSQETVDRELVSNLFISFLQIPRGDSKKYEVLQLISNYLNWSDDMRRHAGLLSSHSKVNSNSVVSTPTDKLNPSRSFVSMWTEFLEKESTPRQ